MTTDNSRTTLKSDCEAAMNPQAIVAFHLLADKISEFFSVATTLKFDNILFAWQRRRFFA